MIAAVQSNIDGQRTAEQFLADLQTICPLGDEIYQVVGQHTHRLSGVDDAFLRGFLRTIQKKLEAGK